MSSGASQENHQRLMRDLEEHQTEVEFQNHQLRLAQQRLEESAARYSDLYDFAPVAYCTLSRSGQFLESNLICARFLGIERGRLVGQSLVQFVAGEDLRLLMNHLAACESGSNEVTTELTLSLRLRAPMVVEMISTPSRNGVVGYRTVLSDITSRKKTEAAARDSERMREDFLSIISHDLRNPLNAILMSTEVLMRRMPTGERRAVGRQQLETIKSSSRRMTRLLADLLDLSSMDAGHLLIEPRRNDADQLIASVLELMAPVAAEKTVSLVHLRNSKPLVVFSDRERTIQVLLNLLTNALKASSEDGTIAVQAHPHPAGVVISVGDSGSGIAPEQLATLFRPYWQADKTVKIGTGLGLSIAKGIVECHGGQIWAESTQGTGSSFYFTLPSSDLPPEPMPSRPSPSLRLERSRRKVLLVDDDEEARESLAQLLESEGYQVTTAENGQMALDCLRGLEPDPFVILLDLIMPVMGGVQFLERRKLDRALSQIPVIVISGQIDSPKLARGYEGTEWADKPVVFQSLLEQLEATWAQMRVESRPR